MHLHKMTLRITLFMALVLLNRAEDKFLFNVFPPNFQWGFSSSSYQVSGNVASYGLIPHLLH